MTDYWKVKDETLKFLDRFARKSKHLYANYGKDKPYNGKTPLSDNKHDLGLGQATLATMVPDINEKLGAGFDDWLPIGSTDLQQLKGKALKNFILMVCEHAGIDTDKLPDGEVA